MPHSRNKIEVVELDTVLFEPSIKCSSEWTNKDWLDKLNNLEQAAIAKFAKRKKEQKQNYTNSGRYKRGTTGNKICRSSGYGGHSGQAGQVSRLNVSLAASRVEVETTVDGRKGSSTVRSITTQHNVL